jgi:hypothetical protein
LVDPHAGACRNVADPQALELGEPLARAVPLFTSGMDAIA